jgi:hypothetical protein
MGPRGAQVPGHTAAAVRGLGVSGAACSAVQSRLAGAATRQRPLTALSAAGATRRTRTGGTGHRTWGAPLCPAQVEKA